MYHLVRFVDDNVYYVCKDNQVKKPRNPNQNHITMVRYKNLGVYKAEIIQSEQDRNLLNALLQKIDRDLIEDEKLNESNSSNELFNKKFKKKKSTVTQSQILKEKEPLNNTINYAEDRMEISDIPYENLNLHEDKSITEDNEDKDFYDSASDSIADPNFLPDWASDEDEEPVQNEDSGILVKRTLFPKTKVCDKSDTLLQSIDIGKKNELTSQNLTCNYELMQVPASDTNEVKKYFCFYCKKLLTKLVRHLETQHATEDDVKKFINLPKHSEERRIIIDTIRKNGMFVYNKDESLNKGKLIVSRRPQKKRTEK